MKTPRELLDDEAEPMIIPSGDVVPHVPLERLASLLEERDAAHRLERAKAVQEALRSRAPIATEPAPSLVDANGVPIPRTRANG